MSSQSNERQILILNQSILFVLTFYTKIGFKQNDQIDCCKNMRIYLLKTSSIQISYQIEQFIKANIIYNLLKLKKEKN